MKSKCSNRLNICSLKVTATFGPISDAIGMAASFWMFAGLSLVGLFFSNYVVVETKGKTMAEIQRTLAGEKLATSVDQTRY